jgi:HPr kinase/phosphorylase
VTSPRACETVHATAVAINKSGVLLIGKSGCGKSDLALRLIDRGATLISDDIVLIDPATTPPTLHVAANIIGKIEIRGIGIFAVPLIGNIPLRLVANLDAQPERLPDEPPSYPLLGFDIPSINLVAFEASAPIKIEYALRSVVDGAILPVATLSVATHESETA